MKVPQLQEIIASFLDHQLRYQDTSWYYPHSLVGNFNTAWQWLSIKGLKATYEEALRSDISNRWWKGDHYRPREIMLQLMDADLELAAIAWKDLQQPAANLEGRLSRFVYYCEQLLELNRQQHFDSIETFHHQDASMLSLYLAGIFPDTYALYPGLTSFQHFCKAVGSPEIPKVDDLIRYHKVTSILFTFLQKNPAYSRLLEHRTHPQHKVICNPYQIAYEIITSVYPNDKLEAK